ncbi:hypothetical protein [Collimonas humicola]|uniref:hypothetical protein n=1 Tax=Collimonas humicola TaxID=2825886 RepID=UPI001B8BB261|nr:hypothetical protein [Collimonas humicola]
MKVLTEEQVNLVSGGMKWDGNRQSTNVIDFRSGLYVDGLGMCYNPNSYGLVGGTNFP